MSLPPFFPSFYHAPMVNYEFLISSLEGIRKLMGRVIAVANQKGGVGKTTTTVNIAASLAAAEKKVLLIDSDPQGNSSSGMGINRNEIIGSTYDLFTGKKSLLEIKK